MPSSRRRFSAPTTVRYPGIGEPGEDRRTAGLVRDQPIERSAPYLCSRMRTRRSISLRPPQMPWGSRMRTAYSRHSIRTGHTAQIDLALRSRAILSSLDSHSPGGKNSPESSPRHAARHCHPYSQVCVAMGVGLRPPLLRLSRSSSYLDAAKMAFVHWPEMCLPNRHKAESKLRTGGALLSASPALPPPAGSGPRSLSP